jgi:hypothetical protein
MTGSTGVDRITADAAVGTSGNPMRVYHATVISGATAGRLTLRNGTSTSGDYYTFTKGAANDDVTRNYEGGMLFPDGCYADLDVNVSAAVISYREEF